MNAHFIFSVIMSEENGTYENEEVDVGGIDVERLFELVRPHTFLYNDEDSSHQDAVKTFNTWISIARDLNL